MPPVRDHTAKALCSKKCLASILKLPSEDCLAYLARYNYRQELVEKLKSLSRFSEAASILCEDGRMVEGAKLLDEMPDAGRREIELSSELHLTYALSEGCDDKESSLIRALRTQKRLIAMDEEQLQAVEVKLSQATAVQDDGVAGLDMHALGEMATNEGVVADPWTDLRKCSRAELSKMCDAMLIPNPEGCSKQA